jgi:hypothetical protein
VESIAWKVEGDQFECRLIQPIDGFGSGEFVRRAGEQPTFQLRSSSNVLGAVRHLVGGGRAVAAGAWRYQSGAVRMAAPVCCSPSQGQASRLINGLLDGRSTVVRIMPVRPAAMEVRCCRSVRQGLQRLPAVRQAAADEFDQVRQTQVGFPGAAPSWMRRRVHGWR